MLSAVKARKPRPRKAPKATSTRGRRNRQSGRPALTFRLYRRPADGPTVPGPLSDRGAVRTGRRVTPLLGDANNTIFIPKFFPKKFGQKFGAGPPTGDFGNGLCAGPGPAPPRPPLVQMKDTPGVLPEGGFSRRGIRRAR